VLDANGVEFVDDLELTVRVPPLVSKGIEAGDFLGIRRR
jgi:hypothetical protein